MAIKIPKYTNTAKYYARGRTIKKNREMQIEIGKVINACIDPCTSEYYRFGYESLGMLLFGFSQWINKTISAEKVNRVFFLARDGYLLEKVYKELYPDGSSFASNYLYISRKSIHFSLLWSFENIEDYLSLNGNKRWYLEMICARLNIEYERGKKYWEYLGLDANASYKTEEIRNNTKINQFYEYFKGELVEKSKEQFEFIKKYFNQMGFSGKIMVVDSGSMFCTTQRCLNLFCKLAGVDAEIIGRYLWMGAQNPMMNVDSYIFKGKSILGGESMLIEFPLTAHEGSTARYMLENGKVLPVLDDYEYSEENMAEIVYDIQKGVMDFASTVRQWGMVNEISPELAISSINNISKNPKYFETKLFGNIIFRSDEQNTYLAKPQKLLCYVTKLGDFKRDFLKTRWQIGFLKRLFILPFPYYSLLKLVWRLYKRIRHK